MLSPLVNRLTAFKVGFLPRLYLLIAALALLLVLLGGSSLSAIGELQGSGERIAHSAARLQASQSFFSALQGLTQNLSDALGAERAEELEAFATAHGQHAERVIA